MSQAAHQHRRHRERDEGAVADYIPELAKAVGAFSGHPTIEAWQSRLYARPAFRRSIERGGAYAFAPNPLD